jgi:hypothetical protein
MNPNGLFSACCSKMLVSRDSGLPGSLFGSKGRDGLESRIRAEVLPFDKDGETMVVPRYDDSKVNIEPNDDFLEGALGIASVSRESPG